MGAFLIPSGPLRHHEASTFATTIVQTRTKCSPERGSARQQVSQLTSSSGSSMIPPSGQETKSPADPAWCLEWGASGSRPSFGSAGAVSLSPRKGVGDIAGETMVAV